MARYRIEITNWENDETQNGVDWEVTFYKSKGRCGVSAAQAVALDAEHIVSVVEELANTLAVLEMLEPSAKKRKEEIAG